jgi:hypothetical protein
LRNSVSGVAPFRKLQERHAGRMFEML